MKYSMDDDLYDLVIFEYPSGKEIGCVLFCDTMTGEVEEIVTEKCNETGTYHAVSNADGKVLKRTRYIPFGVLNMGTGELDICVNPLWFNGRTGGC